MSSFKIIEKKQYLLKLYNIISINVINVTELFIFFISRREQ